MIITIPGNPKALKRHRTFRRGNYTGQYDPSKNDKADFLTICMSNRPEKPFDCPIQITIICYFQRPKSHYRTGKFNNQLKPTAQYYHTSTPDFDNLAKFVGDALNGIFWRDDSLICDARILKVYDKVPRTELIIEPIGG